MDATHLLDEIESKKDFQKLAAFDSKALLSKLDSSSRLRLAKLFIAAGVKKLSDKDDGDAGGEAFFEKALDVCPQEAELPYQLGIFYGSYKRNMRSLTHAERYMRRSLQLRPQYFDATYALAHLLVKMSLFSESEEYLTEALELYAKASLLLENHKSKEGEFYWHFGQAYAVLGRFSEEVSDFHLALSLYKKAEALNIKAPAFLCDFGQALMDASQLVGNGSLLVPTARQAAQYFKRALLYAPKYFDAWSSLALCLIMLYEASPSEKVFFEAYEACSSASKLNPSQQVVWLSWGRLLLFSGKVLPHIKRLEMAVKKFIVADRFASVSPDDQCLLYISWSEALCELGRLQENFELLRQAHMLLEKCVEQFPQSAEAYFQLGSVALELGRYFEDATAVEEAKEAFAKARSLDGDEALFYFCQGQVHNLIGALNTDIEESKKAVEYFRRAMATGIETGSLYNELGVSLMRLGDWQRKKELIEEAVIFLEKAVEQSQKGDVNLDWLYNLGCAYDFLGDYTESEAAYEKAVKALSQVVIGDPSFDDARFNLGLALAHLGSLTTELTFLEKSIELFELCIQEDPEDDQALNELGVVLMNLAFLLDDPVQHEKSRELLGKAEQKLMRAISLGNNTAIYNMACYMSQVGALDESLQYLQKAWKLSALPSIDDMLADEWLENVRETEGFTRFLKELS